METNSPFLKRRCSLARPVRVTVSTNAWLFFSKKTQVQQWTDEKSETRDLIPDVVTFRPAVVHVSKGVGNIPIRNILIEFKP